MAQKGWRGLPGALALALLLSMASPDGRAADASHADASHADASHAKTAAAKNEASRAKAAAEAEAEADQTRDQLQQLKQAMARLGAELERDMRERGSLRLALREAETAVGKVRRDIGHTRNALQRAETELAALRQQRRALQAARAAQQARIARELRAAHRMGRQGWLRILLNQERPDALARAMAYHEYFYRARQRHIDSYMDTVAQLDALEPAIAQRTQDLQAARDQLARQQRQLEAARRQRAAQLKRVEREIAGKDRQLQRMAQDQAQLERLLEQVAAAAAALRQPPQATPFAAAKGRMPWPAKGKPSNRYGRKRNGGAQRWQGLVIPAAADSAVVAIHPGRVVFADWFRGSGLLMIIDHGDGYMSLYAHNEALLRDVGEWVQAGAAIATVGNSGGLRRTALYFEIREHGKPVDPARWLESASPR